MEQGVVTEAETQKCSELKRQTDSLQRRQRQLEIIRQNAGAQRENPRNLQRVPLEYSAEY